MKLRLLLILVASGFSFHGVMAESVSPVPMPMAIETPPAKAPVLDLEPVSKNRFGLMLGLGLGSTSLGASGTGVTVTGDRRTGFAGGISYERALNEYLSVGPEIFYAQLGGIFNVSSNYTLRYDVIEMPILAKVRMGNQWVKGLAFAGPYGSLAVKRTIDDGGGSVTHVDQLKTFDFGLQLGAGAEFNLNQAIALSLTGRYALGLNNLSTDSSYTVKMNSLIFLGGISFGF